ASLGHEVIGVDLNPQKVELLNEGRSPIVEEKIGDLISSTVRSRRLRATGNALEAVAESDISFISVGTPSRPNGAPSLAALDAVTAEIGKAIRAKGAPHTVIVRSTVPPGTTETRVGPALERESGRALGDGLELGFHPEFLREGSSVHDFLTPPYTIIGSNRPQCRKMIEELYQTVNAPIIETSFVAAEAVKTLSNAFHALKIAFANEVGALMKQLGVDGREPMAIFCRDHQLNISEAYLRPGYAFGGSCLPKDLRALVSLARELNVDLPVLSSVLPSNNAHIERAFNMVIERGRKRIALIGLAFKPGTDDLRESPLVTLAERLIGKGYDMTIVDHNVEISRLVGANQAFINREIPHIERLMCDDTREALANSDIVIVGHAIKADADAIAAHQSRLTVIDLQGNAAIAAASQHDYQGICW
ncbi:MAG: nucleotide sugar dehydrogenase, partial [Alphaproteobacteria bacterium]